RSCFLFSRFLGEIRRGRRLFPGSFRLGPGFICCLLIGRLLRVRQSHILLRFRELQGLIGRLRGCIRSCDSRCRLSCFIADRLRGSCCLLRRHPRCVFGRFLELFLDGRLFALCLRFHRSPACLLGIGQPLRVFVGLALDFRLPELLVHAWNGRRGGGRRRR